MNLWGLPFKTIWILSCLGTVLGAVLYALAGLYLATVDGYNETISYCWIPTNNHVPLAIERVIVTLVFKFGSRKTREASEKLRCCLRFLIRLGWLVKPNPSAVFWHGPVCQTHYRARPYKSGSVYGKSSKIGTRRAISKAMLTFWSRPFHFQTPDLFAPLFGRLSRMRFKWTLLIARGILAKSWDILAFLVYMSGKMRRSGQEWKTMMKSCSLHDCNKVICFAGILYHSDQKRAN